MFNSYCHSANFLAFLKDSSQDYKSLLDRLCGAIKDRNFQTERHWGGRTPGDADGRPASDDDIAVLRGFPFGRDAQGVTVLGRLEQRYLTYRPEGKCPWVLFKESASSDAKAGRLLKLYRFKCDGKLATAALVEPYMELTDAEAQRGDHYRKWEPLAGRLYHVDTMPATVIPAHALLHHAVHHEYFSNELGKTVRHLMPLSKVSLNTKTGRIVLTCACLQDPVYESMRADEAYYC